MSKNLLQKSIKNLICTDQGHQNQPLNYICITGVQCKHQPVMCYLCSLQKHPDHEKINLKVFLKQLLSLESKSQKVIPLCANIDQIFNTIKRKIQQNGKKLNNLDLVTNTFQKYRALTIKYAIDFYHLIDEIQLLLQENEPNQKIRQINNFIKNSYFKYFNQVEQQDWVKTNISETLLNKKIQELNSTLQCIQKLIITQKFNDNQVLNLLPLGIDQSRKLKVYFTQDLKPSNMTIISPTHIKMEKSGSQRLVVLEPCLSKTMTVKKWGVKIIKLASWIGVGVCHINQIKKANFMFNYSNTGHGNYLISSNGYSWSSYKKQYNSKFEPFSYTTGDVIHIEYHPKQRMIKFKKQSDPNQPTYQLQVQANDDPIHPQINITGIGDEVQLINF